MQQNISTYLVGTQWNCHDEETPVSTYKKCFNVKITKMIMQVLLYLELQIETHPRHDINLLTNCLRSCNTVVLLLK